MSVFLWDDHHSIVYQNIQLDILNRLQFTSSGKFIKNSGREFSNDEVCQMLSPLMMTAELLREEREFIEVIKTGNGLQLAFSYRYHFTILLIDTDKRDQDVLRLMCVAIRGLADFLCGHNFHSLRETTIKHKFDCLVNCVRGCVTIQTKREVNCARYSSFLINFAKVSVLREDERSWWESAVENLTQSVLQDSKLGKLCSNLDILLFTSGYSLVTLRHNNENKICRLPLKEIQMYLRAKTGATTLQGGSLGQEWGEGADTIYINNTTPVVAWVTQVNGFFLVIIFQPLLESSSSESRDRLKLFSDILFRSKHQLAKKFSLTEVRCEYRGLVRAVSSQALESLRRFEKDFVASKAILTIEKLAAWKLRKELKTRDRSLGQQIRSQLDGVCKVSFYNLTAGSMVSLLPNGSSSSRSWCPPEQLDQVKPSGYCITAAQQLTTSSSSCVTSYKEPAGGQFAILQIHVNVDTDRRSAAVAVGKRMAAAEDWAERQLRRILIECVCWRRENMDIGRTAIFLTQLYTDQLIPSLE